MRCENEREASEFIRKIAEYELISGIVWLVIAILQLCSCWLAFAGGWNLVVAIMRFMSISRIKARDAKIPQEHEGVGTLIALGVINLLLGGIIGVGMAVFDYVIRNKILENRHVFTGGSTPESNVRPDSVDGDDEMELLTRLARLREEGALTEEEFDRLKKELLSKRN